MCKAVLLKKLKSFLFPLLVICHPFNPIQAQSEIQQRFFTSQNGLKISWVHSLTESPDQTIWMGHGAVYTLTSYDGYSFNYTECPQVIVDKVYEDNTGNLWAVDVRASRNILVSTDGNWQTFYLEAGIPFLPSPGHTNKLLFLKEGHLWEFNKVSQKIQIIKKHEQAGIGRFLDMTLFRDGFVWIGGEDGAARFLNVNDSIGTINQWSEYPLPADLGIHNIEHLFESFDGGFISKADYLNSKNNVLAGFIGEKWKILYKSAAEDIYAGWQGLDNSLWILKGDVLKQNDPLRNWNLYHLRRGKEEMIGKNRVLNRELNGIITRPDGSFLIATGSGLASFSPLLWRKQSTDINLNRRYKNMLEDASGRLWFSCENSIILNENDKWKSYRIDYEVFIGLVTTLNTGSLVVGIAEGRLVIFDPKNEASSLLAAEGGEKFRYFDNSGDGNTLCVLQAPDGSSRLVKFDGKNFLEQVSNLEIERLAPGDCEITGLIQAQNGDIWITTYNEVIVFKDGVRKSFDLRNEFEWGISTSILELNDGKFWIGGSNGIAQYDGGKWSHIDAPDFETVRSFFQDRDGVIWVGSGTGVHRLVNGTWISNSYEEGLPDAVVFNVIKDSQERTWAMTSEGVSLYFPGADTDPPQTDIPSEMNISKAVPSGEIQIVFQGKDRWDYTREDQLLFSYRFDDNPWGGFTKNNSAMTAGLTGGNHVFEVRAMDKNGNIDPTPAQWPFEVLLPWYRDPVLISLFIFALLLVLSAVVFAISRHFRIEKLVRVRTIQLNESKEKAEESDRLKSAFLANMSHEIRTPMNGILGFSDLLKKPNLSGERQKKYIGIIQKSGKRMLNIINDIISISKIESGLMEMNLQESNINEQIEYIYTFFKPEIEGKGMQFSFKSSLPSREAILITDREKVFSILTNLLKNAIKYSEKGSIEFGYIIKGETIEFFVKDTGIGIPEDRQEAIFERFIQADISDKKALQGAGLGLSISKAYVEMLGGKIWMESEVGKGSTFYFTLKYHPETINNHSSKNEILPSGEKAPQKQMKVLVAEDDETSKEFLSIVVQEFAKEIIYVRTGNEAVAVCSNNPDIDLILMDIQMPELNGYEASRQIRQFNKDVIIIAQTAYALEGDIEKAHDAGCNDYITKPIVAKELEQMINKHLRKSK
jgi:signal transduction histidine kinase/CheY-like chemotaxis protein